MIDNILFSVLWHYYSVVVISIAAVGEKSQYSLRNNEESLKLQHFLILMFNGSFIWGFLTRISWFSGS